jgi:hypothetical protein
MIKKGYFLVPIILILILNLSVVFALTDPPTQTGLSGTWDTSTYPNFVENGTSRTNTQGFANYTFGNIGNFTIINSGVQLNFTINELRGDRYEWWWTSGVKRFFVGLNLSDGNETVRTLFYMAHEQGITAQTRDVRAGDEWHNMFPNLPSNLFGGAISNDLDFSGKDYAIQILKNPEGNAITIYFARTAIALYPPYTFEGVIYNKNVTVGSDFWTRDLTLDLYVGHEGNGVVDVTFGNLTVSQTALGFYFAPVAFGTDFLSQSIAFLIQVGDIIAQLFNLAVVVFLAIIPWLPWIFLLYLSDVIMTSIITQSVQPIGVFFMQLINLGMMFLSVIMAFLNAIGSIIPF